MQPVNNPEEKMQKIGKTVENYCHLNSIVSQQFLLLCVVCLQQLGINGSLQLPIICSCKQCISVYYLSLTDFRNSFKQVRDLV